MPYNRANSDMCTRAPVRVRAAEDAIEGARLPLLLYVLSTYSTSVRDHDLEFCRSKLNLFIAEGPTMSSSSSQTEKQIFAPSANWQTLTVFPSRGPPLPLQQGCSKQRGCENGGVANGTLDAFEHSRSQRSVGAYVT